MCQEVEIIELYTSWKPPRRTLKVVQRLLRLIPPAHLVGLESVVLRDSAALPRRRRRRKLKRRGRKVAVAQAHGMYHYQTSQNKAWIELFIDRIVHDCGYTAWPRLLYEQDLALVLYHEIGHHIHRTMQPEHGEPEDIADRWSDELYGVYVRRRLWYIEPIKPILRFLWQFVPSKLRNVSIRSS